ncbi:hypothetical protein BV25DRAFT_806882 [Artomyces pyxidatus]|uniref:Uncharacterized protein n=1 Tax=Artomyces pyxidatus TaxID=48021 RepID=A0ACB8SYE8_9AGAM|nr:hypothetical protein BV25DRAFT_806882 [Artomyces pyxidatus]
MPYSPPQNAGLCWCNTVVYSLSAACTACQGFLPVSCVRYGFAGQDSLMTPARWPAWSTTCIAIAANGT